MDEGGGSLSQESRTVCKRVLVHGRVQGVGFRYTTRQVASGYLVTGFVRNLPTGDVEIMAEGPVDQVDTFLAAVARCMAGYLESIEVQEETCSGYKGFQIRH